MNCPACAADFAYQPLIGSPECPNNKCKFYTKRQDEEAIDLFVKKCEEISKSNDTKAETNVKEDARFDDAPSWAAWAGIGHNSD